MRTRWPSGGSTARTTGDPLFGRWATFVGCCGSILKRERGCRGGRCRNDPDSLTVGMGGLPDHQERLVRRTHARQRRRRRRRRQRRTNAVHGLGRETISPPFLCFRTFGTAVRYTAVLSLSFTAVAPFTSHPFTSQRCTVRSPSTVLLCGHAVLLCCRQHFSMWCLMGSPLIAGNRLDKMSAAAGEQPSNTIKSSAPAAFPCVSSLPFTALHCRSQPFRVPFTAFHCPPVRAPALPFTALPCVRSTASFQPCPKDCALPVPFQPPS